VQTNRDETRFFMAGGGRPNTSELGRTGKALVRIHVQEIGVKEFLVRGEAPVWEGKKGVEEKKKNSGKGK